MEPARYRGLSRSRIMDLTNGMVPEKYTARNTMEDHAATPTSPEADPTEVSAGKSRADATVVDTPDRVDRLCPRMVSPTAITTRGAKGMAHQIRPGCRSSATAMPSRLTAP